MEKKIPNNLKELIQEGYVKIAEIPKMNSFDLKDLDKLDAYTVPLISHDYGAKTPIMWNNLYQKKGLNLRNIMLVADPKENGELVINALKSDPKYLGGGFGVGWKERMDLIDRVIPEDLKSINIVVKQGNELVGYNTDSEGLFRSIKDKFYELKKEIEGSNVVLLGSGGVAKEVSKILAENKVNRISILNRSFEKAVELAHFLNQKYGPIATGDGEGQIRGKFLSSELKPDLIINTTDKGSDGPLLNYSSFSKADLKADPTGECNDRTSRAIARYLRDWQPGVVIADIVINEKTPNNPNGVSRTLSVAKSEGLENLINGLGMVVYQAVPAYLKIQEANLDKHPVKAEENEILETFKQSAEFNIDKEEK